MASPSPIHLVFAQDHAYRIPFWITFASLMEKKRSPNPIHCWMITHETDTRNQDQLEAVYQDHDVVFYWIEPCPNPVPQLPRTSCQTFYY